VNGIMARGTACLAALCTAVACTSALKEPPPVAELGGPTSRAGTDGGDPGAALTEAEIEFGKRPDMAAARRAQRLFLDAARVEGAPVGAFLGAARATAWLVEHEQDGRRREELATEGVQISQWCRRLFPSEPECTYRLALAVGQQARERPSTATDGLDVMVDLLDQVIAAAPDLDFAGGRRVLGLVLLRAPGWPTGPGDPELGLEQAEAAVEAFPDYPPNQLVLGEALIENGRSEEAQLALRRGAELAKDALAAGEPDAVEWISQAEQALAKIHR
jgi:hypothetical protein